MKSAAALLALCGAFCCNFARAQQGFRIPNPDVPDLDPSLTIVQGDVVRFAWVANSTYQPSVNGQPVMGSDGRVSLWLTSWAWEGSRWGKLLATSVISAGDSNWAYEVDLTDDEIDRWKGGFTYRLMKPVSSTNAAFDDSETTIISRAFIIRKKSDVTASMASVSASYSRAVAASSAIASTTLATQSTPAANTASATASGDATQSSSGTTSDSAGSSGSGTSKKSGSGGGLSTGAKAGLAIGIFAVAAIGAIAALFLIHRRKRSQLVADHPHPGQYGLEKDPQELQQTTLYRHEAPGSTPKAHEMPAKQGHNYTAELAGSHGTS